MRRTAKLSGVLTALSVAACLLFAPAAASADARTALATPVVLRFEDGTSMSRNTWGIWHFSAKWATTLTTGNWSGYIQHSDGSKTYFCDLQQLDVHYKPVTALFVSRLKAVWCN